MADTEVTSENQAEYIKPEVTKAVETKPEVEVEAEESKSEETKLEETKPEEAKPKDDLKAKAEVDSKSIGNGAENLFSKKRKNYQENVKTDFTAQPETDDPDEIRKQVGLRKIHGQLLLLIHRRLNSISLTLIYPWTSFYTNKWAAVRTTRSPSKSFIILSACVASNRILLLLQHYKTAIFLKLLTRRR